MSDPVTLDHELSRGEHPIGKVVHLSTVTHAWRGRLKDVTCSYFILDSSQPVALVDSTGAMREYAASKDAGSADDVIPPGGPEVRVPCAAVSWLLVWP